MSVLTAPQNAPAAATEDAAQTADPSASSAARANTTRAATPKPGSSFTALTRQVRELGLMRRRYGYYWAKLIGAVVVLAAWVTGFVWIGDNWWQLAWAGVLAVIMTQTAFLGHDAAHRQMFKSGRWNDWISLIVANLLVGISYGWWQSKHTRHHANPNKDGADPDIALRAIAMTPAMATRHRGRLMRWLVAHQGWYFFPILLLEGLSLHTDGIKRVVKPGKVDRRWVELTFLTVRLGGFVALLFWVLPPEKAAAVLAVQLAVFGLYMGSSFAPNHIGMPLVSPKPEARLPPPPGPDEPQHHRRPADVDLHGRPQLPDRAPPVPVDRPTAPSQDPTPGRRLLRRRRRPLHPDQHLVGLPHRHRLPQHRRPQRQRPVPVPTRRATPRPLTTWPFGVRQICRSTAPGQG